MSILQVGDQSFEQEVLRSDLPVLVDLYADWCQPCKQIAPLLQTLAEAHAGKLKVVQVDIDHNPVVAQSFQVQSIPMLLVFQGGRMVNYHVGMLDRARLDALVEAVLPPSADEVKPQELAELLQAGRALPIDIRDAASFARYHIPAAEHHAADALRAAPDTLQPTDGRMRVLYGRGGDEAKELSHELRGRGLEVSFLAGGFLHWEAEGLPVTSA